MFKISKQVQVSISCIYEFTFGFAGEGTCSETIAMQNIPLNTPSRSSMTVYTATPAPGSHSSGQEPEHGSDSVALL